MVSARTIYVEGGGNDSKELHIRCREGFRKLLEKSGFGGRMPRLVACGGRTAAFDEFSTAHSHAHEGDYVAMWIDSEDPVADIEQTWAHLKKRDGWNKPTGAVDEQVLLMTTCMETWIASDHKAMRDHWGACLQASALPSLHDLESRNRATIQEALVHATRTCKNGYSKGKRSFQILAQLVPVVLRQHLPSFVRCERVLQDNL